MEHYFKSIGIFLNCVAPLLLCLFLLLQTNCFNVIDFYNTIIVFITGYKRVYFPSCVLSFDHFTAIVHIASNID